MIKKINYKNVDITRGFLYEKQTLNESVTINAVYDRFYETGRVEAFDCKWQTGCDLPHPHIFWDSDVAKWIEGAAYVLKKKKRPDLIEKIEHIIDMIERNQWDDGYINSYYTITPQKRFTDRSQHELYCCGHLIEAAIAYYETTGRDRFLKLMLKYVDLVDRIFRVEKSAAFDTPGHEEIELALFRLYRLTKDEKHLRLAKHFVDTRGLSERDLRRPYDQMHLPAREQLQAVGHAVRAHYFYTAMADYAKEIGDNDMLAACRSLFQDISERKMYITGSAGSTYIGEAYTIPYDLPNETAYTETCAAISLIYFCDRMLSLERDAAYADVIERALYNGVLAGLSLDGKAFFYENPLSIELRNHTRHPYDPYETQGEHLPVTERAEVFLCSCCPPNLNRFLASIGDYLYAAEDDTLIVHQFAESNAVYGNMKITQKTDYPRDGRIRIETEGVKRLMLRIPAWCDRFTVSAPYKTDRGYAVIDNPPPAVEINFDMRVRLVYANEEVYHDIGRAAVTRGPVVYCAEGRDNGVSSLESVLLSHMPHAMLEDGDFQTLPTITVDGYTVHTDGALYSTTPPQYEKTRIRLIPYHAFANRGADSMAVFLHVDREK